jgi:hypothetical protein
MGIAAGSSGLRRVLSGVLSWIVLCGFRAILSSAQGIEAEIPEELRSNSEELERKARFPALAPEMRPVSYKFLYVYPEPVRSGLWFFFVFRL